MKRTIALVGALAIAIVLAVAGPARAEVETGPWTAYSPSFDV